LEKLINPPLYKLNGSIVGRSLEKSTFTSIFNAPAPKIDCENIPNGLGVYFLIAK